MIESYTIPMSSLFSHVFIPLILLLAFSDTFNIRPRNIIILAVFGILPDADILFDHRALFHNIFILLVPVLLFVFDKKRREIYGIICFYLASHILLDIFDGGAFFLYPIYEKALYVHAEITLKNYVITPVLKYGLSSKIKDFGFPGSLVSSENIAVAVIMISGWFITLFRKNNKKE